MSISCLCDCVSTLKNKKQQNELFGASSDVGCSQIVRWHMISSQWCAETPSVGGGAFWPTDQLLLLKKKKVTQNTSANSLAAWLIFHQLSCKFENIGPQRHPSAHPWLIGIRKRTKGILLDEKGALCIKICEEVDRLCPQFLRPWVQIQNSFHLLFKHKRNRSGRYSLRCLLKRASDSCSRMLSGI